MHQSSVILLVTLDTKEQEATALQREILDQGVSVDVLDISLGSKNRNLSGDEKIALMSKVATERGEHLNRLIELGAPAVVGLGGGTGSQIILKIFRQLGMRFPKLLVSTLPFDPRDAVSDNSIIIVPTLCDIQGMNSMLRDLFQRVAHLVSGMVNIGRPELHEKEKFAVAITALGVTNRGVLNLQKFVKKNKLDSLIFHSNGYGGAALVRAIDEKIVDALIDFTPHELTRMRLSGAHVDMPRRFTASVENKLPMIIVPGGLNFIGLGSYEQLEEDFKKRPFFRHSELFTHVGVLPEEMIAQTEYLMDCLNAAELEIQILVPMKGFSTTDKEGQELHSPELRYIFLETARKFAKPHIRITDFPDLHIEDVAFSEICSKSLLEYLN